MEKFNANNREILSQSWKRPPAYTPGKDAADILHAAVYGLSDPAMKDALYDSESIRRLAGVDIAVDVVRNAGVHDSQVMKELLHGEEQVIYGDRAYTSEKKRKEYEARGIKWCVNRKACRHYQLTPEDVEYNHRQSQVRAKGEHAFLVLKHLWHYTKVIYNGLFKNAAQVFSLFALADLYLVRRELLSAGA